jgi:hypothetical protein
MSDTTTPENVVPFDAAPETPNAAPLSSDAEQIQQAASDVSETPVAGQADLPAPNEANTIDLNTITHEDVIQRLIDVNKRLTYELLISLKLHEHINVRDNPELAAQAEANAAGTSES